MSLCSGCSLSTVLNKRDGRKVLRVPLWEELRTHPSWDAATRDVKVHCVHFTNIDEKSAATAGLSVSVDSDSVLVCTCPHWTLHQVLWKITCRTILPVLTLNMELIRWGVVWFTLTLQLYYHGCCILLVLKRTLTRKETTRMKETRLIGRSRPKILIHDLEPITTKINTLHCPDHI